MTDVIIDANNRDDIDDNLLASFEQLKRDNQESRRQSEQRVVLAEMKVEAMRAGMVDLDGLIFLDLAHIDLDDEGNIAGATELINKLRHKKPWLFSTPSSSSGAKVPPSRPARQKLATEMTDEEYRVARANLIQRSAL